MLAAKIHLRGLAAYLPGVNLGAIPASIELKPVCSFYDKNNT